MAIVALTATKRSNLSVMVSNQVKASHGMNILDWTIEVGSADSDTSTYLIGHLPSNCRISGLSWLGFDDLATSTSPTLDIGTYNFADGTSDDVDSMNDGLTPATPVANLAMLKDLADNGLYLWEIGTSPSSDPGGFIDIKIVVDDADIDQAGTISGSIVYRME